MIRIESAALLVRSVPFGEADLIATFFTESAGRLSAIVRGARRSTKRFGGALEPIHELAIALEDKGKELCVLKEARIARARIRITADLDAMEAAGNALRWIRHLCPARTPEPGAWRSARDLLEALDALDEAEGPARSELAARELCRFGLRLLADVGYGLELGRCIRCGRECPPGRAAHVDTAAGGLVCSACGGARSTMSGALRGKTLRLVRGGAVELAPDEIKHLLGVVEDAMAAHTGFDRQS